MFNFIKSLVGAESYLGVDIGTTSIKIAEISVGKIRPKLKNYGFLESYEDLSERANRVAEYIRQYRQLTTIRPYTYYSY